MRIIVLAALAVAFGASGCGECAGMPSCTTQPTISYTGEFINHKTGKPISGVRVEWVRTHGIEIDDEVIRATSDSRGFFQLQGGSVYLGEVFGELRITPPAPFPEYVVRGVQLTTSRRRGDGGNLGRLVVDPFLILVGEVHDLTTGANVSEGTVTLRRIAGGRADPDVVELRLESGRWYWVDPPILDFGDGTITAEFEVRVAGDSRVFRVTDGFPLSYRDGDMTFLLLHIRT
jgi:hypothetical protein